MSTHHRPEPPPPAAATGPPVPANLLAAARAFFPAATEWMMPPGDHDLVRVVTPAGDWRVRRWPPSTPPGQIELVHHALQRAKQAEIAEIPTVATRADGAGTVVTIDNRHADAQRWLPGALLATDMTTPAGDPPLPSAQSLLAEVAATLARVHLATGGIRPQGATPALSLERTASLVRRSWEKDRQRLRPVAGATPLVQRWVRIGERVFPQAIARLAAEPALWTETPVVGHTRLRPGRVLTVAGHLSGIIGWEGAAFSSPLLDLAQLTAHFGGWHIDTAETVLGAYHAIRPLPPEARRHLIDAVALDLIASTGQALVAAFAPRADDAAPSQRTRAATERMVVSLEAAARSIAGADTAGRAKRKSRPPTGAPRLRSAGTPPRRPDRPPRRRPSAPRGERDG